MAVTSSLCAPKYLAAMQTLSYHIATYERKH
jgi:hypothetical protein